MARITLLRHGKAEMPSHSSNDYDRPLNQRGRQNSAAMGQFITAQKLWPDMVLVSTAQRTRETFEIASQNWPTKRPVQFVESLYESSAENLLNAILSHAGSHQSVLVIGHNPSLAVLLNHLTRREFCEYNTLVFPTCALADIGFKANLIREIDSEGGKLLSFKKVRELTESFARF
jgi:phosphohistidine phosphatase